MLGRLINQPLSEPTGRELAAIHELRTDIDRFLSSEQGRDREADPEWTTYMRRLQEHLLDQNPREFLRWDFIRATMFFSREPLVSIELKYLKSRSDWMSRWRPAIRESPIGHPLPYFFYPSSSGNLIHHAYHLAQFENKTKSNIDRMKYILEFGGGYGCMCRLMYNLDFKGKYIIYDLPPFAALQRYYLRSLGLTVHSFDTFRTSESGVICLSDSQQLRALCSSECIRRSNSMFVATWSLSETPVTSRHSILPLTEAFGGFLLAYQDKFGDVNNVEFFNDWQERNKSIVWYRWPINHLPGNTYLIGKRENSKQ